MSFGPGCVQSDAVAIGPPRKLLVATQMQHSRLEGPLGLALGHHQAGLVEHGQKVCQSPSTRAPQAGVVIGFPTGFVNADVGHPNDEDPNVSSLEFRGHGR
eukprot:2150153-Alexandrium_andersonii.AAC.1